MSTITRTRDYDRGAILADLRAGTMQRDVATKHGVSTSLVSRLAVDHGLTRPGRSVFGLYDGAWVLDPVRRIQVWRAA